MARKWQGIKALGVNTVLLAVTWEVFEPKEGQFKRDLVASLVAQARETDIRVILSRFGSMKGSVNNGKSFHPPFIAAEKAAFAEFEQQIEAADAGYDTILMLQIGSEIAYLNWSRDICDAALAAFDNGIPADYLEFLVRSGSVLSVADVHAWEEFANGPEGTDELFTTYHIASHINSLAKIAKETYSVPVIVNVALEQAQGRKHGGPRSETLHLWKPFAPYIHIYAPQMFHDDYSKILQAHGQCDDNIRLLWSAFGTYAAIVVVLLNIEDSGTRSLESQILQHTTFLRQAVPFLLDAQDQGQPQIRIATHIWELNKMHFTSGEFYITINMRINRCMGYGLAISQGNSKLLLFGQNIEIKAKSRNDDVFSTRILSFRELELDEQGVLQIRRTFNADEARGPKVARIRCQTSMIAEVQFHGINN
ncbi:uncharacterized protein BDZ83DRAFT_795020 [Colletotrichum acutatum]|uniref:DUF5597 domain-containing protein n=1 Tax=Glomerella acutata TaxID=27357 RepID=A0AAD8XBG5_GLOAC|nr:uncharacterized protein BDZ83DRAFT_795020 [Colletotrichum acutatum]KAK1719500.1 hypothetical protein BDZ83DRAFT_795020 [Colletotrichum acutatum]